jgi:hypothetical protein
MRIRVLFVLVFLLVSVGRVFAASGNVTYDSGEPNSPAAGQIEGSGSYDCDVGFMPTALVLKHTSMVEERL